MPQTSTCSSSRTACSAATSTTSTPRASTPRRCRRRWSSTIRPSAGCSPQRDRWWCASASRCTCRHRPGHQSGQRRRVRQRRRRVRRAAQGPPAAGGAAVLRGRRPLRRLRHAGRSDRHAHRLRQDVPGSGPGAGRRRRRADRHRVRVAACRARNRRARSATTARRILFDLYDRARAAENQVVVAAANLCPALRDRCASWPSPRSSARTASVAVRTGFRPGLAVADVDVPAVVAAARASQHHLAERRPDAYPAEPCRRRPADVLDPPAGRCRAHAGPRRGAGRAGADVDRARRSAAAATDASSGRSTRRSGRDRGLGRDPRRAVRRPRRALDRRAGDGVRLAVVRRRPRPGLHLGQRRPAVPADRPPPRPLHHARSSSACHARAIVEPYAPRVRVARPWPPSWRPAGA